MLHEEVQFDDMRLSAEEQAILQKALKGQLSDEFQEEEIPKRGIHSPVPLSYPQQRLWVLDQLAPGNPFYNTSWSFRITGKFNIKVFEACINEIIRRHEVLRTVFTMERDEPVQVILPELKIGVDTIDLRSLPVEEQREESVRLAGEELSKAFDLEKGPLIRATLLQQSDEELLLLIIQHHIIFDGWSKGVLVRDFTNLYEAFSMGRPSPLPELAIQYADFSLWQRKWVQGEVLEKQLSFWKELLSGELPLMELPADRQRPAVPSFKGDFLSKELPAVVGAQLIELSQQQKCSMFMTLLAALNILFYRYSGQEDILMGFPIANRSRTELEHLIGFFANTLVFRTDLSGNPTFRELQNRVRKMTSDVYDNQDVPFEKLIEEFQPDRYLSHTPFFQVMVHYGGPLEKNKINFGELAITEEFHYNKTSMFDLWITMASHGYGIQYNSDIFDEITIKRMMGHINILLASIGADPDQRISDIPILTEEEKTQILVQWNNIHNEYNWRCLHHAFEAQVEKTPDRIALGGQIPNPKSQIPNKEVSFEGILNAFGVIHLTYRELNEKSDQLASLLIEKGVGLDTIVGIMMERSIEMITGLLGILKAGGAYLPIDSEYPLDRIKYMLEDCQAPILLTMSHHIGERAFTRLQGLHNMESSSEFLTVGPPSTEAVFNSLPIPDRSLVNYEKYSPYIGQAMVTNTIALQTTRGCPYKCAYCHKIRSKKHVIRTAENIFEELLLYYQIGFRRFVILDDIFNLNKINSTRFFQLIIKNRLKIQLFFPNGLRGDLLTKDYIDLMVEAGTVSVALALETASPRLQKLIGKNLNLEKFKENISYFCEKHPQVILELFTMHGFPTETQEEARMTLDFLNNLKWVHFPYIQILKIYPNTDMAKLAIENGIPIDAIDRSSNLAFHELPDTLPFEKSFTYKYRADFLNDYFLSKDRLRWVLPFQRAILTEDEIVQKYISYLQLDINSFNDLLLSVGISEEELGSGRVLDEDSIVIPDINEKIKHHFPAKHPGKNPLKILLLDLSQLFSFHKSDKLYEMVEPPLGLMYIMTYLNQQLGSQVNGKIAKSRLDFDSYEELEILLEEFKPDVIGIRTLTFYKDFFHKTTAFIKQRVSGVPIIAGGPYASSDWTTILQDRNIDLVIRGEGELSFTRLVSTIIENNGKLPDEKILATIPGAVFIPKQEANKKTFPFAREILMLDSPSLARFTHTTHAPRAPRAPRAKDLAYIIYTSGSTGNPKGVMIDHQGISNRLLWMQEAFGLNSDDRILQKTPFNFDVSVWEFFWPLLNGAALVVAKPEGHKDCAYLLEVIKKEKITFIHFVPSMLYAFLEEPGIETARSLKRVIASGEALPTGYVENFYNCFHPHTGTQLYNLYGPTEASVDVTYWSCTAGDKRSSVPIGRPIANTQIYILDHNSNPVPIGVAGELYIAGIQLARGYLNRPELTHEKFLIINDKLKIKDGKNQELRGKHYKTGDLARWLSDGTIEFLGRQDFQVKIRGFRIELGEIESKLRSHPFLEDAVVINREDVHGTGDKKLCAYIIPGGDSWAQYREKCVTDLVGEQVSDWQEVFNNTYIQDTSPQDPYFNTAGWNSSYTSAPIPSEEMRQWVNYTVERILSLKPKPGKVLEIGCGNGLLLFPIIPRCQFYRGTDISEQGLDYIRQQLSSMQSIPEKELAKVELSHQPADHFQGIETKAFDLVILNSVVQYFPGMQYLLKVLTGSVNSVKPGGYIFVGDVRSLPLLKAFHASVEFHKAKLDAPNTTGEQLNQKVRNRLTRENELALDPSFFTELKGHFPRIKHVEVHLKRGQYHNELIRFRYDVILRIDVEPEEYPVFPLSFLDWQKQDLTLSAVRQILREKEPEYLAISRVPNSRIARDLEVLEWVERQNPRETVEQFLPALLENQEMGVDPEDFWSLQGEFPYQVDITLVNLNSPGAYDVVLRRRGVSAKIAASAGEAVNENERVMGRPFHIYANNPLLTKVNAGLVLELRSFLKEKLPEYMVPSYFILLEKLPLTHNGKLDRKALLRHESLTTAITSAPEKGMGKPRTPLEEFLAKTWKEVLLIDELGSDDNFFQLGGDSINAIQVISRVNKQGYSLSVRHLYLNNTIAQLADYVEHHKEELTLIHGVPETPTPQVMDMGLKIDRKELFSHLPPGTEIDDIYPLSPFQKHMLSFYLSPPSDWDEPGLFVNQVVLPMQLEAVDIAVLEKAFQRLTDDYPYLRTAFMWEHGGEPVQVVYKQVKAQFEYRDLSHLSAEEGEKQVRDIITAEHDRGFERNKGNVYRICIIRLRGNKYLILQTGDLMRGDGWSSVIVNSKISEYYWALFNGQSLQTEPPDTTYKKYVSWLSRRESAEGDDDYWFKMVQGCSVPTPLIARHPQNAPGKIKPKGFTAQHIYFSQEETKQIDEFLKQHQIVLSALGSGIWSFLLSHYTGQKNVVFGMLFSGRGSALSGVESMVGQAMNILPMRVDIPGTRPILAWLKRIIETLIELNKHDFHQQDRVRELWNIRAEIPLFESYFVLENFPGVKESKRRGVVPSMLDTGFEFTAQMEYPLRVELYPVLELRLSMHYYRRWLTDAAIEVMLKDFRSLMLGIIANPYQQVGELSHIIGTR